MQMNRFEHDLWVECVLEVCADCWEDCQRPKDCVKLAERIVERKAEIAAEG